MPCYISCALATIFVISSIFMSNATQTNKTIQHYQSQLPSNLQNLYAKITEERNKNDKHNNGLRNNHNKFPYKLFLLYAKSKDNIYVTTYKLARANKGMANNV